MSFVIRRSSPWRRYEIVLLLGEQPEEIVVARFWSWDRADDVVELLKRVVTIAVEEARR